MTEYLLTTNEYLEPAKVTGSKAYAILAIRLILMNPGEDPLRPEMGVGIKKYRFISTDNMSELQTKIQNQFNTYLPEEFMNTSKVYLQITDEGYLSITIETDDTKYVYDTGSTNAPIELIDNN